MDDLAFVGDPGLFRPAEQPVFISCTFTWDIYEAERLFHSWSRFYSDVRLGGPAFGDRGGDFTPGRFLKPGVTITSRGCPKSCPWCMVPAREGGIREVPIRDGWDVQDNNLLACSFDHVRKVFEMLAGQRHPVFFHGGLDSEFLTEKHVGLLDSIRVGEMWFACDSIGAEYNTEKAAEFLSHYPRYKKRCYVLVGFNGETVAQAEKRLFKVWDLGFLPFAMPYRSDAAKKEFYGADWLRLIKTFSRPPATKAAMKARAAA